jgi:hypothetical protein
MAVAAAVVLGCLVISLEIQCIMQPAAVELDPVESAQTALDIPGTVLEAAMI